MKTIIIILIFPFLILAQETERRDGNYWRQMDNPSKGYFVLGILDGMELGENISRWALETHSPSNKKVEESLRTYNKDFRNVSNLQICDGLDSLYSDYKNRSILIWEGAYLVVQSIKGIPQEIYEKMLEDYRKLQNR